MKLILLNFRLSRHSAIEPRQNMFAKEHVCVFTALVKRNLALGTMLLALAGPGAAQQDFSQVQIQTIHVAGNIYMLQGSGGNIGVSSGTDGQLIVDDQFAPLSGKIEAALKNIGDGRLKFVLNTHFHGDHTGGNAHFGRQAPIIAHDNVRQRLRKIPSLEKGALPVITFGQSLSLHFNGEEIRVTHLPPGHTDSDSIIHFTGANVFHMGDSFFSGRFPNIDLAGGGDVQGFIRNIEQALKTIPPEAKIIPGHGPLSTLEDMKKFHEMLIETTGIVQRGIAAGKNLEQLKADGLPEKWKKWEAPTLNTARWIEIVYASFTRPK